MPNTYQYMRPAGSEERERRRALAQALMQRGLSPQVTQGPLAPIYGGADAAADLTSAITGALMNRKLKGEETAERDSYNKTLAEALRGPQAPADGVGPAENEAFYTERKFAENPLTSDIALQMRLERLRGGAQDPSELRTWRAMTEGLNEQDREKARRVQLGLDPRPTSGFIDLGDRRVNPGTGQSFPVGLKPSDQPDNAAAKAAAEAAAKAEAEKNAEQNKKVPALTNLEYLTTQFKEIQGKTSTGGPLGLKGIASRGLDYQNTQRFNNIREQISTELRTIFRIPGEGTLSDREMAQYGLQLPDIKNDPQVNDQIMVDINTRAATRLGQGGAAGGDGNVKNWEDLK